MEFIPSKREILRRKIAFTSLMASLTCGMFLFARWFDIPLPTVFWLVYLILFSVIGILTFPFLHTLRKRKLTLTQAEINLSDARISSLYLIKDIVSIAVKHRKNGIIREIRLIFNDGKSMYLSAFEEQFDVLKDVLDGSLDPDIKRTERFERFDYDHPLFYPCLGFLLSGSFLALVKAIALQAFDSSRFASSAISALLFFLGPYFIQKRPIGSRTSKPRFASDLLIGIAMILGAALFLFTGWI
ncbi:MAG: hypothetical protein WBL80_04085 [Erysipelotrichaceae bacterium]